MRKDLKGLKNQRQLQTSLAQDCPAFLPYDLRFLRRTGDALGGWRSVLVTLYSLKEVPSEVGGVEVEGEGQPEPLPDTRLLSVSDSCQR